MTKERTTEILQYVADLERTHGMSVMQVVTGLQGSRLELNRAHELLDGLDVPQIVSEYVDDHKRRDELADRLRWMFTDAVGADLMRKTADRMMLLERAADHLKKLAEVYIKEHDDTEGTRQTHPWIAVRWAKEHL